MIYTHVSRRKVYAVLIYIYCESGGSKVQGVKAKGLGYRFEENRR